MILKVKNFVAIYAFHIYGNISKWENWSIEWLQAWILSENVMYYGNQSKFWKILSYYIY